MQRREKVPTLTELEMEQAKKREEEQERASAEQLKRLKDRFG